MHLSSLSSLNQHEDSYRDVSVSGRNTVDLDDILVSNLDLDPEDQLLRRTVLRNLIDGGFTNMAARRSTFKPSYEEDPNF